MSFSEILKEYLSLLDCSCGALARESGVSAAVLSRYRNAERTPSSGSVQISQLAEGIAALAQRQGVPLSRQEVFHRLSASISGRNRNAQFFGMRLNMLMEQLGIPNVQLSRYLNYDPSTLSRIRAGRRHPADGEAFTDGVYNYLLRHCPEKAQSVLSELLGCQAKTEALRSLLYRWLWDDDTLPPDPIQHFLTALDHFDLQQYLSALNFDAVSMPVSPHIEGSQFFYGLEGMRRAELSFLWATAAGASSEPVFMCSDMPMDDMAQDRAFGKKWMLGIAAILSRGLSLYIVHYLDRPFSELMLGLESWIPLYMTGRVVPRYLPGSHNRIYGHLNYCSGAAALSGECIAGHHTQGRYYLSNTQEDLGYYRQKMGHLWKKARPLMEIYGAEDMGALSALLPKFWKESGCRRLSTAPPLYTLPNELLERILDRNNLPEAEIERLLDFAAEERRSMEAFFAQGGERTEELKPLTREEFLLSPPFLPMAGAFPSTASVYCWEEYEAHLCAAREYAGGHAGYRLRETAAPGFRQIDILICPGKWVLLSKQTHPTIHFLIRQPTLRTALERLELPIMEKDGASLEK